MADKKKSLDELKGAMREGVGFEVENLQDEDLEVVSGGQVLAQCQCRCSGNGTTCGGGGGGGSMETAE